MKLKLLLATCVFTGCCAWKASAAETAVMQYHFAGSGRLAADENYAKLEKVWSLPASIEYRSLLLQQGARALTKALSFQIKTNTTTSILIQPLLEDLIRNESIGVFGGSSNKPLGFVLAVAIDKERAQFWENYLRKILGPAPEKIQMEGLDGLQWKGTQNWRFSADQNWVVLVSGNELPSAESEFLKSLKNSGRPVKVLTDNNCLEADIDWVRLANWLPLKDMPLKLARTRLSCNAKGENLKTTVQVIYPESIVWTSQPWRIPTNLVSEPLISFTAGQNVAAFMNPVANVSELQFNPFASQFFVWAQGTFPFLSASAVLVDSATNTLRRVGTKAPEMFNPFLQNRKSGHLEWDASKMQLTWKGLQMLAPYVVPRKETSGEYIAAYLFPPPSPAKPAPKELLSQVIGRKDLVYYDWELTGHRLKQWYLLAQVLPILPENKTSAKVPPQIPDAKGKSVRGHKSPKVITEAWVSALEPVLGNSATEVSRTGPNELTLVRKSPFGFTGIELVMLAHWVANVGN